MNFEDLFMVWILIFTRISAMFFFLPMFNSKNISPKLKIGLYGMFSYVFLMSGNYVFTASSYTVLNISKYIVVEVLNGMCLGLAVLLIMNCVYIAGSIIDTNIGFSMMNLISVQDESTLPITANLYYIFFIIVFITTNAHHILIEAFNLSLKKLELGTLSLNIIHLNAFTELMSLSFTIAFRISLPIIFTILLCNLILGLLSKSMSGMNVFVIGVPFKILIAFMTIGLVIPTTYNIFIEMLEHLSNFMYGMVGMM